MMQTTNQHIMFGLNKWFIRAIMVSQKDNDGGDN